jgi:hypothetical protein
MNQQREGHVDANSRARRRRSVERAMKERRGAESYKLRQRAIRRREGPEEGRAHPLEFDTKGFSIPQPLSSFVRRVARLTNVS